MKEKTVYVAVDGTQWQDAESCRKYEAGEWVKGAYPPPQLQSFWVLVEVGLTSPLKVVDLARESYRRLVVKGDALVPIAAKYGTYSKVTHWRSNFAPEAPV